MLSESSTVRSPGSLATTLPKRRKIRICSNLEKLAAYETNDLTVAAAAPGFFAFAGQCWRSDLVVIDGDAKRLLLAALFRPFASFKLVSVDLILRPPIGGRARAIAGLKRLLLRAVDKFILYFRNTEGFLRYYGIRPERIAYVPFKVNGCDQAFWPPAVTKGDYVLCAGRTLRDLETFVAAMARTGLPAVLLQQPADIMKEHGTTAWERALPPNVRLELHTDGKLETFVSVIANARLLVIPRFKGDICSTGISSYLVAMALGTAVVISRGPGADDILSGEAAFVEPENIDELAQAVSRLWHDDVARGKLVANGKRYAENLGGTARLNGDIIQESLRCLPGH